MVSIPACHAGDQGSIPWRGAIFKNQKIEFELSSSLYQYFNNNIYNFPTFDFRQQLWVSFIHAQIFRLLLKISVEETN